MPQNKRRDQTSSYQEQPQCPLGIPQRSHGARREVLEETGIHIDIIPDFTAKSDYTIQGKVEKSVTIFLAKTEDTETIIQREEIDDYIWLGFDKALETLKFENDKAILKSARRFMDKHGIFETDD